MLSPSRLHRRTSRGPLPRSSSGCRYSQDMRVSLLQSKPLSGRGGFSAGAISGFLGASPFPASPQFIPGLCARSSGPKTGRPVTSSIAPRERAGRVRKARCLRVVGIALIQKSEWWSRQAFSRCWLFSRAHGLESHLLLTRRVFRRISSVVMSSSSHFQGTSKWTPIVDNRLQLNSLSDSALLLWQAL